MVTGVVALAIGSGALGFSFGKKIQRRKVVTRERRSLAFTLLALTMIALALGPAAIAGWTAMFAWPADTAIAAEMGQRGDFFGGFVNPLLTFATFVGFLYTVKLQRDEIQEAREQARVGAEVADRQGRLDRQQAYQAAFFQLLSTHNDIVNSIRVIDPVRNDAEVHGRAAFRVIYSALRRLYRDKGRRFSSSGDERVLGYAYERTYLTYQYELAHYFRSLYNTILLLEEGAEAERYIKLLRAQLSQQELLVLFYNCAISPHGLRFRALAERHQLFDNMPPHLLEEEHAALLPDGVFGPGGYTAIVAARNRVRGDMRDPV